MKLFRRARLARRRAALRLLNAPPPPPPAEPSSAPNLMHLGEWAAHPYVCGASTFLVALYMQRMWLEERSNAPGNTGERQG